MKSIQKHSISFVIPAYNCQHTLAEAVDSIYSGNFTKGDEVIIVDDASEENTFDVAKSLQKKYPAVHIYRHHYNKGSAAAGRNTAIDQSRNELIFCLDADNVLAPQSIPTLKEYMIRSDCDVAVFNKKNKRRYPYMGFPRDCHTARLLFYLSIPRSKRELPLHERKLDPRRPL